MYTLHTLYNRCILYILCITDINENTQMFTILIKTNTKLKLQMKLRQNPLHVHVNTSFELLNTIDLTDSNTSCFDFI